MSDRDMQYSASESKRDPLGIRSSIIDDLRTQCAELKNALRISSEALLDCDSKIRELEQGKCGLAADALNARQLLREFMAYVKCGQVPEDAHCARMAKRFLDNSIK